MAVAISFVGATTLGCPAYDYHMNSADVHEVQLIPTPHGWGIYCRICKYRAGPFTKKDKAEAVVELHRNSVDPKYPGRDVWKAYLR